MRCAKLQRIGLTFMIFGNSAMVLTLGAEISIDELCCFLTEPEPSWTVEQSHASREQCRRSHAFFAECMRQGTSIYGVNTGFGSSSKNRFDASVSSELQTNLF